MDIDPKKEQVRFSSRRFLIGDSELDAVLEERLQFEFEATMSYKSMKRYRKAADVNEKGDRVTRILQVRKAEGAIVVEAETQTDGRAVEKSVAAGIASERESTFAKGNEPLSQKDFLRDAVWCSLITSLPPWLSRHLLSRPVVSSPGGSALDRSIWCGLFGSI